MNLDKKLEGLDWRVCCRRWSLDDAVGIGESGAVGCDECPWADGWPFGGEEDGDDIPDRGFAWGLVGVESEGDLCDVVVAALHSEALG